MRKGVRDLVKGIEARGYEVVEVVNHPRGGGHGKMTVRLPDRREVRISLPCSPSHGERISLNMALMHLRAAENRLNTGRRDRD